MWRTICVLSVLFFISLSGVYTLGVPSNSDGGEEDGGWGYRVSSTESGPYGWGKKYATCALGKRQSPINIVDVHVARRLTALIFDYQQHKVKLVNTGKVLRMVIDGLSRLVTPGGEISELKYVEFHTPSEHRIRGIQFPLEMQLHHISKKDGSRVVVSQLFTEGRSSAPLERFVSESRDGLPRKADPRMNDPLVLEGVYFNPENVIAQNRHYFTYKGSMTAPPCEEGVTWYVMADYSSVSEAQSRILLDLFRTRASRGSSIDSDDNSLISIYDFPGNARPVQNWNGRTVLGSQSPPPRNMHDDLTRKDVSVARDRETEEANRINRERLLREQARKGGVLDKFEAKRKANETAKDSAKETLRIALERREKEKEAKEKK